MHEHALVMPSFPSPQKVKWSQCRHTLLFNFSILEIHNTGKKVKMAA